MPVSEPTPYYLYALVKRDTGELVKGGGSSTAPRLRIYTSLESANRGIKGLGYPKDAIEIVEYRLNDCKLKEVIKTEEKSE